MMIIYTVIKPEFQSELVNETHSSQFKNILKQFSLNIEYTKYISRKTIYISSL